MSEARPHSSTRFAAVFAGGTMLSRVLGLARDIIVGALVSTASLDAFLVAFRFPNMLRDILGEGAANSALVPTFTEAHEKGDPEAFRKAVAAVMGAMMFLFGAVTLIAILLLPFIPALLSAVQPITHGDPASAAKFAAAVPMMQWTFPYLLFIGMAVFATAPLFVLRHYSTPSWSPALLNVAMILCCVALYRQFEEPAWALVIGVWLGGLAQCFVMYRALFKKVGVTPPSFHLRHPAVPQVFWLLLPVIIGQSAGTINKMVNTLFAASLEDNVVTALSYGDRLTQLPLAIFAVAVSVAILPELSRAKLRGEKEAFHQSLINGFSLTFFLVAPAMAGILLLAGPIVRVLFQHGEFGPETAAMTATAVLYYGAGLLAFSWIKIAVQGFYAVQETRTPVIISVIAILLNLVLNFLLVRPMGYQGLALSTTLAFYLNFTLLFLMLQRRHGRLLTPELLRRLLKSALATLVMAAVVYALHCGIQQVVPTAGKLSDLLSLACCIAAGILSYLAASKLLRVHELDAILHMLRGKYA